MENQNLLAKTFTARSIVMLLLSSFSQLNSLQIHMNKLLRKIRNDYMYLSNITNITIRNDIGIPNLKEITNHNSENFYLCVRNLNQVTIPGHPDYGPPLNYIRKNNQDPPHSIIFIIYFLRSLILVP